MELFKGIYRVPSARLQNWDYTRGAWYYVTLCTRKLACFFGEVVEGKVVLSPLGRIVAEEWQKTPRARPNVSFDQWQIMPNHLHGILVIEDVETPRWGVSGGASPGGRSPKRDVPAERLYVRRYRPRPRNSTNPKSLSRWSC